MRFSEIEDCNLCLMMKKGYCNCNGGITNYGRGPVYPPCSDNPDKSDEEAVRDVEVFLRNKARKEQEETVKRNIIDSKKKRSEYMRMATLIESSNVSNIKKNIKAVQKKRDTFEIHLKSRLVVDSLFENGRVSDEEIDRKVASKLEPYNIKLNQLKCELKIAEDILTAKRREVRGEKEYKQAGSVRRPRRGYEQNWEKKVIDSVGVSPIEKMWGCVWDLEKNGYDPNKYLFVFIRKSDVYYLRSFDGFVWKDMGYLEDLGKFSKVDKLYRDFLRGLLKDLEEKVEVIVLPSRMKGYSFYGDYPACFRTYSDFKEAFEEKVRNSKSL